jgi:hypothetical protein
VHTTRISAPVNMLPTTASTYHNHFDRQRRTPYNASINWSKSGHR